jgi:plastocyanin
MKIRNVLIGLLLLLTIAAVISCKKSDSTTDGNSVTIDNDAYSPSTLTVKKGTTVTWTNNDSDQHTVTSDAGSFLNSGLINPGSNYQYTATTVGTFLYHCEVHSNMHGTLVVTD